MSLLTVCASKSKKWRRRIDWSPLLLCSLLVLTISPPTSPQPRDWLELLIRRVQISFSYRSCSRAITFAKHKGRIISSSKTISGASNHCHDAESCKGAGSSYTRSPIFLMDLVIRKNFTSILVTLVLSNLLG
ncbi:hypothetical protein K7X08_028013 [Anisodus acutangulus]|uniref:Uncharacterized protein n=1 Tax=Anisodus acutangulus TaxID=402998 RepID=A0A9Q1MTX7_9SOLA|nr:hypothetical protein K7X08_028013 [Anisodus acutangulus]